MGCWIKRAPFDQLRVHGRRAPPALGSPHRGSLSLTAQLLRLPLTGEFIYQTSQNPGRPGSVDGCESRGGQLVLLGLVYMAGDVFSAPQCVTIVIGCLIGICAVGLAIQLGRTRHDRRAARDREFATRADRREASQEYRLKADELRAFWNSPEGQFIHHMPAAINESVRIQPLEDTPRDPLATGQLSLKLDEDRMAVVDIDLTRRQLAWRYRVVHAAVWLANRPWWAGRPITARIFRWVFLRFGVRRIRRVNRAENPSQKRRSDAVVVKSDGKGGLIG